MSRDQSANPAYTVRNLISPSLQSPCSAKSTSEEKHTSGIKMQIIYLQLIATHVLDYQFKPVTAISTNSSGWIANYAPSFSLSIPLRSPTPFLPSRPRLAARPNPSSPIPRCSSRARSRGALVGLRALLISRGFGAAPGDGPDGHRGQVQGGRLPPQM